MKILIISDSHGYDGHFFDILAKIGEPDMVIHCGDVHGNAEVYRRAVSCPVRLVAGNNDMWSGTSLESEAEFDIEGHHIFLTHGHRYGVSYDTERILDAALSRGADVVLYGHTHRPRVDFDEDYGIWAVNPGSISMPRQSNGKPSYCIMETGGEEGLKFTLYYL